jgi:hypothetical protein
MLAGCDYVYGLNGRIDVDAPMDAHADGFVDGVDDDGDGEDNDVDLCPHIAFESQVDDDQDGISRDCDPDDHAQDMRLYLSIVDGVVAPFNLSGMGRIDGNGFILGAKTNGFSTMVLGANAGFVDLAIGYEMQENSIDDMGDAGAFSEIGMFAANINFNNNMNRGNVCFFGRSEAPQPEQAYLELDENQDAHGLIGLPLPLHGSRGTFHMARTPSRVDCTLDRDGVITTNGYEVSIDTGRIAISAERTAARIDWIWVAYH